MSAAGRSVAANTGHVRSINDFYETPSWCIDTIAPHLHLGSDQRILDPGCGTGAISHALKKHVGNGSTIHGIEINEELACTARLSGRGGSNVFSGDFLQFEVHFDWIIGNPPYSLALEFAEHALQLAPNVAFLLRLNWLASKSRAEFHRRCPADIYVLPKRPSFTKDGKTDATEYCWFVWGTTENKIGDLNSYPSPGRSFERGNRWFILETP